MAKSSSTKLGFKPVVCKPCWELKYCPYGPLVEFFPLITDDPSIAQISRSYKSWINAVKAGRLKTKKRIYQAIEKIMCLEPESWKWANQFRRDDLECTNYGHVCPVFLSAEPFTETRQVRNIGRRIPRDVMFQVMRRDGRMCNMCGKNVPDSEVEFDHRIPFSKGGPTTADNLRLMCRPCNRKKRSAINEIVAKR